MGRQLFLHHYLPSHLASSLVTGSLLEFVFSVDPAPGEVSDVPAADSKTGKKKTMSSARTVTAGQRLNNQNTLPLWGAAGALLALVIGGWYFFLPLTYGKPGLDVSQVLARKWLGYDLHFAK